MTTDPTRRAAGPRPDAASPEVGADDRAPTSRFDGLRMVASTSVSGPPADAPAPLRGVRVLALEQMQALPYATQLMARLGADVVKVEPPTGDLGRASLPAMADPDGRRVGATFLRNNLNKRTVSIDLKDPRGRRLVLDMAPRFDVFAENFKAGTIERLGLGFEDVAAVHPRCVYASVSGFGNATASPYRSWPAFAPIVEAMSGIYEMKRVGDEPPLVSPVGALGDIGAALFCTIGVLSALRLRDQSGDAQYVDIAMYDAVIAMTDIVTNFWSLGLDHGDVGPVINHGFRARDGWFIMQVGREQFFARLAEVVGRPQWTSDPRLASRQGWMDHLESELRPAIESWAADKTKLEACEILCRAGIAAGPCFRDEELVHDPHVVDRHMLTGIERPDGGGQPVLLPGNPIKLGSVPERNEHRIPWLGEHTDAVLTEELELSPDDLAHLRADGVIA
jgi:crotonobetainyl-CoA:carnitine CoA-transferase CaiB-like acyl-CoA transferase